MMGQRNNKGFGRTKKRRPETLRPWQGFPVRFSFRFTAGQFLVAWTKISVEEQ